MLVQLPEPPKPQGKSVHTTHLRGSMTRAAFVLPFSRSIFSRNDLCYLKGNVPPFYLPRSRPLTSGLPPARRGHCSQGQSFVRASSAGAKACKSHSIGRHAHQARPRSSPSGGCLSTMVTLSLSTISTLPSPKELSSRSSALRDAARPQHCGWLPASSTRRRAMFSSRVQTSRGYRPTGDR